MPDFDANDGLARLPGAAPGERLAPAGIATTVLRYTDLVIVVLVAPVALALGAPMLGYAIGAGGWVAQRVLAQADRRLISRAAQPGRQMGLNLFEAFGRIWLLAGAIVLAGIVGGRADGLTCALVVFCSYSVAFAIRVVSGPPALSAPPALPPAAVSGRAVRGAER
jgi:hypothetical protein